MIADKDSAMMPNAHIAEGEFVDGLLYCHYQLSANASKLFEALAYSYSLIEVLIAKGIIGIEELNQRKDAVAQRIAEQFQQEQIGVCMYDEGTDKYNLEERECIADCESRWPICRAICCQLEFPLSPQDVAEGIVRWKLGQPYMNRKGESGHCVHLDLETCRCTVYEHRPAICRSYDCRHDERIWLDFENRVINPALFQSEPAPA
jgi:Fe-S-cluster containining protein